MCGSTPKQRKRRKGGRKRSSNNQSSNNQNTENASVDAPRAAYPVTGQTGQAGASNTSPPQEELIVIDTTKIAQDPHFQQAAKPGVSAMKSATYDEDDVLKSPVGEHSNQQNAGGPSQQNNPVPASYQSNPVPASYVSMPEKPKPQPAYPSQPAAYPQGPQNPQPPVNYNNQQPPLGNQPPPNGDIGSLYPEQPTAVVPQAIAVRVVVMGSGKPPILIQGCNTTESVFELRFQIFEKTRILPSNQMLTFNGTLQPLHKMLGECGIVDGGLLHVQDQDRTITDYICEITDAKTVRGLKIAMRDIEDDLSRIKNQNTIALQQENWPECDRLVQEARKLQEELNVKQRQLEKIHEQHRKGFRSLHIRIMKLFDEMRNSCGQYAKLKRSLLQSVSRNEVMRSRDITDQLMVSFIKHDGCERELLLIEGFAPDMVEVGRSGLKGDTYDSSRHSQPPAQQNKPPQQYSNYNKQQPMSNGRGGNPGYNF